MKVAASALLFASSLAFSAGSALSFAEAKNIWEASKGRKEYDAYSSEFVKFNNRFHLDEKDGCYALGAEPVELMLVISRRGNDRLASVEQVLSSVDNAKARCFRKSYRGIEIPVPPASLFIMQMTMG